MVQELHRQFRERTVKKAYLCIVDGDAGEEEFTVDAAIGTSAESSLQRYWSSREEIV